MALGTTVPAGAGAGVLDPQLPSAQLPPQLSPQHELVGSQQKRLRNSLCSSPSSQQLVQLVQLVVQVVLQTGAGQATWQVG